MFAANSDRVFIRKREEVIRAIYRLLVMQKIMDAECLDRVVFGHQLIHGVVNGGDFIDQDIIHQGGPSELKVFFMISLVRLLIFHQRFPGQCFIKHRFCL